MMPRVTYSIEVEPAVVKYEQTADLTDAAQLAVLEARLNEVAKSAASMYPTGKIKSKRLSISYD